MKYLRHSQGVKDFGNKVKYFRKLKGLSQEQLAWETGMEFSQINRIENGVINTSISSAFVIAEALKIEVWELFKNN
jgi:transcriptional regulator with XRE-family HTH domain